MAAISIRKRVGKRGTTYTVIVKDTSGDHLSSKTFPTKKFAEAYRRNLTHDELHVEALELPGARMTLAELRGRYLRDWYREKGVRVRDMKPKRTMWWVDRLGNVKLTDLRAVEIRRLLDEYQQGEAQRGNGRGKRKDLGRPRAGQTVTTMKSAIASMLKYARDNHYINRIVTDEVKSYGSSYERTRHLDEKELAALLAACRESEWIRLWLLVRMAVETGPRQGKLLTRQWSDVDLKKNLIRLEKDQKNKKPTPVYLPFSDELGRELVRFREVGKGWVFPDPKNPEKHIDSSDMRVLFYMACHQAGIETGRNKGDDGFIFHDLRHTHATMLLALDYNVDQIGESLGHRDPRSTKRYSHLSVTKRQEMNAKLGEQLSRLNKAGGVDDT